MKTIFLIGYMGCGKTTLGAALAAELEMPFIDLDDFIEERCECRVSEIFERVGEDGFRQIEQQALQQVAHTGAIVACGGGTPCHGRNMEIMNATGLTIWLTAGTERITSRLLLPEQKAKRPLIADMDDEELYHYVARNIELRTPHYSRAHLRFDSTRLESAEEIRHTARALAQMLVEAEIIG